MNTIKRYWILEIVLLLIAVTTFIFFVNETLRVRSSAVEATPEAAVLIELDSAESTNDMLAEASEDDEPDDEEVMLDEAFAEEDEGEFYLIDAAAHYMQVEIERVERAVHNGMSLAEIATQLEVDVQVMIDALVAQELAYIDRLVQTNEIDTQEAADWRVEAQMITPFLIKTVYREPDAVAARTIGIDLEALYGRMDQGQTIAQIAQSNNVEIQTVINAIVISEQQLVDAMMVEGVIEAEEGAEWIAELSAEMESFVNEVFVDEGEGADEEDV